MSGPATGKHRFVGGEDGMLRLVHLLLAPALAIALAQILVTAVDILHFGLPPVREAPPAFVPFRIGQALAALVLATWLVTVLFRARPAPTVAAPALTRSDRLFAVLSLGAGAGLPFLLWHDPLLFHRIILEDGAVEWASALLLLGASALLAWSALSREEGPLARSMILMLSLLLFLTGMEEVSWMQRVVGFSTPPGLAEANWQAEFNLHNVQTDLSEAVYYSGAGFFLLVLPLLRMATGDVPHWLWRLLPGPAVALISAPVAFLNFGQWDLFAIQFLTFVALGASVGWGLASLRQGRRGEGLLFLAAALLTILVQGLLLALGWRMIDLPDASEYKEFFITAGFFHYAAALVRTRGRSRGPTAAIL